METGNTGFKVLKDKNMIESKNKLEIQEENKNEILDQIKLDTELLKKHELIDYSMFLIQIDSQK